MAKFTTIPKYVRGGEGLEELFDLDADPRESHNLAGDEALRVRLRGMPALGRSLTTHPDGLESLGRRHGADARR